MEQSSEADLCTIPLAANPDGLPPNFQDPSSLQSTTIGLASVLVTIAIVVTTGRLYVNRCALNLSDYFMAVGLVLDIGITGIVLALSMTFRHHWDIPICLYVADLTTKLNLVEAFVTGPALFFPKAAICLFYLQIFSASKFVRIGCKTGFVLAFLAYFPGFVAVIYYETPYFGQTLEEVGGASHHEKGIILGIIGGASSVVVDIYIFILPLPTIFSLNMAYSRKMQLLSLFTTAFLGIVASVVNLVFRVKVLGLADVGWQSGRLSIAIVAENNVAIIVGSLPGFVKFLQTNVLQTTLYQSIRSKLRFGANRYISTPEQHRTSRNRSLWTFGSPRKNQLQYHGLSTSGILASQVTVPKDALILTRHVDEGILCTVELSQHVHSYSSSGSVV
ncbi:hypothetical protein F5Y07DRAFT_279012 [Xylaria sp. FL0933]|nr:hypothetical protein F5Y07DRAFT_279012 [Xylaria sp. FL0933]